MFCNKCGQANSESNNFCESCGEKLQLNSPDIGAFSSKDSFAQKNNFRLQNIIEHYRSKFNADFFTRWEDKTIRFGSIATPIVGVIGAILGLATGITSGSFIPFLIGVAWFISLSVCYYIGFIFLDKCKAAVLENPSTISGMEYLDVVSLSTLLSAAGLLIGGSFFAFESRSFELFWLSVGGVFFLVLSAYLSLNPKLISISVDQNSSAGNDAISILMYSGKALIRMAGFIFGAAPIFGLVSMLSFIVTLIVSGNGLGMALNGITLISELVAIPFALVYPFVIYLGFIGLCLIVDLINAILSISKVK